MGIIEFEYGLLVFQTSVVTTRRVLERLAVHYVSQRMAWKLLKGNQSYYIMFKSDSLFFFMPLRP